MATVDNWDEEKTKAWNVLITSWPEPLRLLALRMPPNKLYRMKSTGERCTIRFYTDADHVQVAVTGDYNFTVANHLLHGVRVEDLEECDLPMIGERLGVICETQEELAQYIMARKDVQKIEP